MFKSTKYVVQVYAECCATWESAVLHLYSSSYFVEPISAVLVLLTRGTFEVQYCNADCMVPIFPPPSRTLQSRTRLILKLGSLLRSSEQEFRPSQHPVRLRVVCESKVVPELTRNKGSKSIWYSYMTGLMEFSLGDGTWKHGHAPL